VYIPKQGDIVTLDFEPSAGKEISKRRPALVLSRSEFNQHTRLAIVAPITSTVTGMGLEVVLTGTTKVSGAILIAQLKSFDFGVRNVKFVESAEIEVVAESLKKAKLIIS